MNMGFQKINHKLYSIRLKLIAVFLIPVAFLVFLGITSYRLASSGLVNNYESNARVSLDMMGEYYELGLNNISNKVIQLVTDETIQKYYSRYYSGDSSEASRKSEAQKKILAVDAADEFISDIYVFADYGYPVASPGNLKEGFYDEFLTGPEAAELTATGGSDLWIGKHPTLDGAFPKNTAKYSLSYIKKLNNSGFKQIGCVVIDIDQSFIKNLLSKTDFGAGSITGFVTGDGVSVLNGSDAENFDITKESFYQKAITQKEELASEYVDFQKESCLFLYSKLEIGNSMVFALIPKTEVISQAEKVKLITVIIVILTSIVALAVGILISNGIGSTIHKTNKVLSMVSEGNLTVSAEVHRKDEFQVLGKSINHMLASMKTLIEKMFSVSTTTAGSANEVSLASKTLLDTSRNIAGAVTEIEHGVQQQAADAQNCLLRMSELASQIAVVQESTDEIEKIAGNTKQIVSHGIVSMNELNEKHKATTLITRAVITEIEKLELESKSIIEIIKTMNEISEQTNLLSLNASIEAARAGDAGRGFAVVADEIRKLAEKSQNEAQSISRIIQAIREKTRDTVSTARKAEDIVNSQDKTLLAAKANFDAVNIHVESLTDNLDRISAGVVTIGKAKDETLSAIENISSTLEETAAAQAEVSTTAENQLSSVEQLNKAATRLGNDANNLKETVSIFQIA